ncbi:MAG: glucose-6-phosphate dehydrogenase, partial [Planctomycetota bacterium]|nr:glucose-6-phosphate dehydrogenase [Planctomycetota bacterium]
MAYKSLFEDTRLSSTDLKAFLMAAASDTTILIFGASGDLTSRKLIPALFRLSQQQYLSPRCPVIGVARRAKSHEEFRSEIRDTLKSRLGDGKFDAAAWDVFARQLFYQQLDITNAEDYPNLDAAVKLLEAQVGSEDATRIVYLATTPDLFAPAVQGLDASGMIPPRETQSRLRVVVEKPFGRDLKSAQELTAEFSRHLHESQIYRIDHYLGKETVQNILLFRFGNAI